MKLYATINSERASKGQGGNKYLYIEVKAEKLNGIPTRQNLYCLKMEVYNKELSVELFNYSNGETIQLVKSQKAINDDKKLSSNCKNKDEGHEFCWSADCQCDCHN